MHVLLILMVQSKSVASHFQPLVNKQMNPCRVPLLMRIMLGRPATLASTALPCHHRLASSTTLVKNHLISNHNLTPRRLLSSASSSSNQKQLEVTPDCLARIKKVLEPDEVIRVGVKGGGCSGFEYEITVDKRSEINADEDLVFHDSVVVDRESIELMVGSKLDYENTLIRSGFRIVDNPLAEKGCSCGASFSIKF